MPMSELDTLLLQELQKDGRKSYTELAEKFGANVSTVSNRVQRLIDNGVLKIVGVVNPFETGNTFVADIKMKVEIPKLEKVVEELSAIQEVRFLVSCTGPYNLLLELYTSSNDELYKIINGKLGVIDGIKEIETSIILKVHKQSYDFGVNLGKGKS